LEFSCHMGSGQKYPHSLAVTRQIPSNFQPHNFNTHFNQQRHLKTEMVSSYEMSEYLITRQHKNPHLHNKFKLSKHDTSNKKHEGLKSMCDRT
jgi:hypothetical protein